MAEMKEVAAATGKVAAGGAGAAAGGYFSFELYKDLDVGSLLHDHQVYGLTVLFFVAAVILATGYAALPEARQRRMRELLIRVVPALLLLSLVGFGFQMWEESRAPPAAKDPAMSMKVKFIPKMAELNDFLHQNRPADKYNASLSVEVDDPGGNATLLDDGSSHVVKNLHNDQLLQVMIPHLDAYIRSSNQSRRETTLCGGSPCDSEPAQTGN